MINVRPCLDCGRILFTQTVGGVEIRTETEPLDGQGAVAALVGGTPIYRVTYTGGRPEGFRSATPDILAELNLEPARRPQIVREHGCVPAGRPADPSMVLGGPASPKARQAAAQRFAAQATPSSAPSVPSPAAPSAASRPSDGRTDGPTCDGCGKPCEDGTYASIALGDLIVWAAHTLSCAA